MGLFESDSLLIARRYRKKNDKFLIELELENPKFLFDRKDPSPIKNRDINEDVIDYILNSLMEIPEKHQALLKITFLNGDETFYVREKIISAIKKYFVFEVFSKDRQLKNELMKGFKSFFIGFTFLFLCIYIPKSLQNTNILLGEFVKEGLNVLGWVSMWKPIQIFLYEWWPIRDDKLRLLRASKLEVDVTYRASDYVGHG